MPKIHVHKPFTLTHDDGTQTSFVVGAHEVEAHVADHWYVKAHSGASADAAADRAGKVNSESAAELAEQRRILDSAAALLDGRAEQLAKLQEEVTAREGTAAAREAKLNEREEALRAREAELDGREDAIASREAALAAAAEGQGADPVKAQQQQAKKR